MSIRAILQAFGTIFPAELPDKTMIATILLVTRYKRPLPVWIGAVTAFSVHVVVAVGAGKAISLLPKTPVHVIVALLFTVGALLLLRAARSPEDVYTDEDSVGAGTWAIVASSFTLIVLAEWGDLTQLAMASLAAKSGDAVSIGIGSLAALAAVAAIAAAFGRQLVARVPIHKINYVGAAVFAGLAIWTVIEILD